MTEKNLNPNPKAKKDFVVGNKNDKIAMPVKKEEKMQEEIKTEEKPAEEKTSEEKKKPIQKKAVVKKTEAVANGISLPISTKVSRDICKFIKYKKISDAVSDLEKVIAKKKAVPMKGEIPHRKGKIMAGRFPKNASEHFINILKTLGANANVNGIENPVISEAVANIASRPYGRFGRFRRKRTHLKIIAKDKIIKNKNSEEKK